MFKQSSPVSNATPFGSFFLIVRITLKSEHRNLLPNLGLTTMKRVPRGTMMELQDANDAKGSCHEHQEKPRAVGEAPHAPTDHVRSCTNHDPPSADLPDVSLALSLPSKEQYSKCTYALCFDFSILTVKMVGGHCERE